MKREQGPDDFRGWQVETCFGPRGCPNRAVAAANLAADLEERLAARGLGVFLRERVGGPLKPHHEFRVSVSDCPNACSRPQIADVGLIGASEPRITLEQCHQCLACVDTCQEGAIQHPGLLPIIDPSRCVRCGKCTQVCVSGTLQPARRGYRILLGGRLGRRPRLGTEINGIFGAAGALEAVECCLEHYLRHCARGERFGDILERTGLAELEACIRARAATAPEEPPRPVAPILRGPV